MFPAWFAKPEFYIPILVSLALFVLSLYKDEIRGAIDTRPTKARNWWRTVKLNSFQRELDALRLRHQNSYELTLYAFTTIGEMAIYAVVIGFIGMTLAAIGSSKLTAYEFAILVITYFAAGPFMIAASLIRVFVEFRHLKEYDERAAYLEKEIADLT